MKNEHFMSIQNFILGGPSCPVITLDTSNSRNRNVSHSQIHLELLKVFGKESKEVRDISAIDKGANQLEWIVSYRNRFPSSILNKRISINGTQVIIEDVSKLVSLQI